MPGIVKYYLYSLCLFAGLTACATAQVRSSETGAVIGNVNTGRVPADTLTVMLTAPGEPDRRFDLRVTGDFEFHDLPIGSYELQVLTFQGDIIYRKSVYVSAVNRISVRLPDWNIQPTPAPGAATVSAVRLQHNPPGKARKEFAQAAKASRKEDRAAAIEHLKKAIELDPKYMEAHYNLGVQYLNTRRFELARSEFQAAVTLDPGAPSPWVNLSSTLLLMGRSADAEVAIRKALRLDGNNVLAHYLLSISLLTQGKQTAEAVDNLKRVSDTYPHAQKILDEISKNGGTIEGAGKLSARR